MAIKYESSWKSCEENVTISEDQPEVRRETQFYCKYVQGTRWFQKFSLQTLLNDGLVILVMSVVILVIFLIIRYEGLTRSELSIRADPPADTHEQQPGMPGPYPIDSNETIILPPKLNIITRREWLAQPVVAEVKLLQLPVPYVFIMETGQIECRDPAACTFNVRFLQSFHMDRRGWDDIGYNFLVGSDGFAYEGRGWKSQGAHTSDYNSKSIGIAFIGNFNLTMPPERQIIAAKQLINIGVEKGYIDPNFKLLATRQVESTKTPGLALYEDLQKWTHWAEQP